MLRYVYVLVVLCACAVVFAGMPQESFAIGFVKSVTPLKITPKGPGAAAIGSAPMIESLTPVLSWSGSDYFTQKKDTCVFAFYRVMVRDEQGRTVVDEVVDTDATSYRIPAGILRYGRTYAWSFELVSASLALNAQTRQIDKKEYHRKGSPEALFFRTPRDPRQAAFPQPAAAGLSAQLVSSSPMVNPQQALMRPGEKVTVRVAGGTKPYLISHQVAGLVIRKISDTEFELTMPGGKPTQVLATKVSGNARDIKKVVISDTKNQQFIFYYGAE